MNTVLLITWAIAGWCGTVPRPRFPVPPIPDPFPFWIAYRLAGVIGGVVGGLVYSRAFPIESLNAINVAATAFAALLGGILTSDLAGSVTRLQSTQTLTDLSAER